ncbi:unnamed protein product, partial [Oppiella nova]
MTFIIESDYKPNELNERIEAFIQWSQKYIHDMNDTDFETQRQSLIARRLEKPKQLLEYSHRLWSEISSKEYDFNRDEIEVKAIKELTKQDIIAFFERHLSHSSATRKKLTVSIISENPINEKHLNEVNAELMPAPKLPESIRIENITQFKTHLGFYSVRKPVVDVYANDTTIIDDLLAIIFSKLNFGSVLSAQTVCKRWLDVSKEGFRKVTSIWIKDSDNYQTVCEPYGFNDLSNTCVIRLSQYISNRQTFRSILTKIVAMFPNLKRLYVRLFELYISKDIFLSIAQSCVRDLQSLSIICGANNVYISEAEALLLAIRYPNIRVLQLQSNNLFIEQSAIDKLLQNLPKLEVFALNDTFCHNMANSPVYDGTVYRHLSTGIKVLITTGNILTPDVLQDMVRRPYHRLRELMVHQFDIKCMALIARHFQSIEWLIIHLDPDWCSDFTAQEFNQFIREVSAMRNMTHFTLNFIGIFDWDLDYNGDAVWDPLPPDFTANEIQLLGLCPKLKKLEVTARMSADSMFAIKLGFSKGWWWGVKWCSVSTICAISLAQDFDVDTHDHGSGVDDHQVDNIIGDITSYVGDLSHGLGDIGHGGGGHGDEDDEDIDDNHENY